MEAMKFESEELDREATLADAFNCITWKKIKTEESTTYTYVAPSDIYRIEKRMDRSYYDVYKAVPVTLSTKLEDRQFTRISGHYSLKAAKAAIALMEFF